jgi:ABC-2 type transport system permease protein
MNANPTFPAARVTPNLSHAWGGIWRLTYRRLLTPAHWLTLVIALGVLVLLFVGGLHGGGPELFLEWTPGFYVTFLVPAVSFMAAAGAMRDEMKSSSVDYVLTRPVPRPAFVGFKFLAHTLCLQVDFLVAFAVVTVIAVTRQVPHLPSVLVPLFFGQVMMVTAFSALGFLCGAFSTRYIIYGLGYAGIIEAGVGQIPTQISRLSMTQQMRDLLAILLKQVQPHAASPGLVGTTLIIIAFTVVMVAAAAAIITLREISSSADT